jgi:hypothetical protein
MDGGKIAIGVYWTIEDADKAATVLQERGFNQRSIFIFPSDNKVSQGVSYWLRGEVFAGFLMGALSFLVLGLFFGLVTFSNLNSIIIFVVICVWLGSIGGTLLGLGTVDPNFYRYRKHLKEGRILLIVNLRGRDEIKLALGILAETGAEDISAANAFNDGPMDQAFFLKSTEARNNAGTR